MRLWSAFLCDDPQRLSEEGVKREKEEKLPPSVSQVLVNMKQEVVSS